MSASHPRPSLARRFWRYAVNEPLLFWGAFFGTVTVTALVWSLWWAIALGIFGAVVTALISAIQAIWRIASEADDNPVGMTAEPDAADRTRMEQ